MTVVTGWVAWSTASQLPTVFSDTRALAKQIAELERKLHPPTRSPDQRAANEAEISHLRDRENVVQQQRSECNASIASLKAERRNAEKQEQEIREREKAETQKIEAIRRRLSEAMGRDLRVYRGPPLQYDPGPEPTVPWYGETPAYVLNSTYRRKVNAWYQAKIACDLFNAFQRTTYVDLATLQGKVDSFDHQIEAFQGKLAGLNSQLSDLVNEVRKYTDAPWASWEDLDEKRRQLARTSFARTVFWILDLPTLASCLVMTAVAYSRMFLIAGRFGARQLARGRP